MRKYRYSYFPGLFSALVYRISVCHAICVTCVVETVVTGPHSGLLCLTLMSSDIIYFKHMDCTRVSTFLYI